MYGLPQKTFSCPSAPPEYEAQWGPRYWLAMNALLRPPGGGAETGKHIRLAAIRQASKQLSHIDAHITGASVAHFTDVRTNMDNNQFPAFRHVGNSANHQFIDGHARMVLWSSTTSWDINADTVSGYTVWPWGDGDDYYRLWDPYFD